MIINKIITEYKSIKKEIIPPYYCKKDDTLYCVLDEEYAVRVTVPSVGSFCAIVKSRLSTFDSDIAQADECTETEFINAFDLILNEINLHDTLQS